MIEAVVGPPFFLGDNKGELENLHRLSKTNTDRGRKTPDNALEH